MKRTMIEKNGDSTPGEMSNFTTFWYGLEKQKQTNWFSFPAPLPGLMARAHRIDLPKVRRPQLGAGAARRAAAGGHEVRLRCAAGRRLRAHLGRGGVGDPGGSDGADLRVGGGGLGVGVGWGLGLGGGGGNWVEETGKFL